MAEKFAGMTEEQIIQAEVKRLIRAEKVVKAWSPESLESKPSEKQLEPFLYLASQYKYLYLLGGNQSFSEFNYVLMSDGTQKSIKDVGVGDWVKSLDFKKGCLVDVPVVKKWNNGVKPVYRWHAENTAHIDSTEKHEMVQFLGGRYTKRWLDGATQLVLHNNEFEGKDTLDLDMIELLGYLLGDGCLKLLRNDGTRRALQITNSNKEIQDRIELLLKPGYTLNRMSNGDNKIYKTGGKSGENEYISFIRELGLEGHLAGNKFIPEVIFTQSINARRRFLGALVATDGWISKGKHKDIGYCSTSERLIRDVRRLAASLGYAGSITRKIHANKNHADEWSFRIRKWTHMQKFFNEVSVCSKDVNKDIGSIQTDNRTYRNTNVINKTKGEFLGDLQVFDLTVDHPDHNYICNGIIVGNSGKTNGTVRNVVWLAEESSPYWRRPSDANCNNKLCGAQGNLRSTTSVVLDYECPSCGNIWRVWDKDEPINIMVVGQQLKNLQENLYFPRIKRLFQFPEDWKEDKLGSAYIQKITNVKTGNTIVFFPHGHGEEKARTAVQGYTVHAVFTDEQIPAAVAEELQRRVDAKMGMFFSGFTMKTIDTEYLRMIDAQVASGAAKSFKLSKLDNPVYEGSKDIIMRQLAGMSEAKRNAVLYGEVSYGDEYIFASLPREEIMRGLPPSYKTNWRHVEILDPAIKSKAGRLVMAQDPETKIWHVTAAQYMQGMLYDAHLYEAHLRLREKEGYHPVLSVADDDAGFIGMARHHTTPTKFIYPPSKRSKTRGKLFLIKQAVGVMLAGGIRIDAKYTLFWDELNSYRWKDQSKAEIVNSHKYHLLDCLQYFIDTLPDDEKVPDPQKTYEQEIVEANLFGFVPSERLRKKQGLQKKTKTFIMSNRLRPGTMK